MASASSPSLTGFMSSNDSKRTSADSNHDRFHDPHAIGSSPRNPSSPQRAPKVYIHEYQRALAHLRHSFDSERVMWNMEREGLLEKIATLETSLRPQEGSPNSRRPVCTNLPMPTQGSSKARSSSGPQGAKNTAGKSAAQSVRAFSESATYRQTNFDRLSSVAENTAPAKSRTLFSESLEQSARGVSDPTIQKHYDGITFKAASAGSAKAKEPTPNSGTLIGSSSSARESPGHLQLPTVHEEPLSKMKRGDDLVDNLTKDAGHTPLARYVPGLDGTASALDSDLPTPMSEQERPPLEPRASLAKVPSERADSYFPLPDNEMDHGKGVQELDSSSSCELDPELRGPLGLRNERSNDDRFLNELDSKLAHAATSPNPPTAAQVTAGDAPCQEGEAVDEPEPEPKLRIKRSMNFGSQLGGTFRPEQ
ncbi:MAG: hypothetical protein L6R35_003508 [Caloplaca aegaea]|nr:MAG: hypothetical protein L6R35_003508 [Caloplaca aegaea]